LYFTFPKKSRKEGRGEKLHFAGERKHNSGSEMGNIRRKVIDLISLKRGLTFAPLGTGGKERAGMFWRNRTKGKKPPVKGKNSCGLRNRRYFPQNRKRKEEAHFQIERRL